MICIHTYTNIWLEWFEITIEVDANRSLPTLDIIWLPDAAIKEAKERIRMTLKNSNISLPPRKIVLNLAPSHIRKMWTRFDLPMAVAVLFLIEEKDPQNIEQIASWLFFWELWLDGSIKKVTWLLPSVIAAYKKWKRHFFVPQDNVAEISCIPGILIYPLTDFWQLVSFVQTWQEMVCIYWHKDALRRVIEETSYTYVDFADIRWHAVPKRALTIAATGMHNLLMCGPPWSGKSMLAKSLQSILSPLTFKQIIEVSQIYSLTGKLSKHTPLLTYRPYRVVHHTASKVSIIWWGRYMRPWEISLAHLGILFFDELPEFPREVLEVLRQPLEDKCITISRAQWSVHYPADVMFVAAMNPCKCWFYKDQKKVCTCSLLDIKRYQSRISWPLLDRFDMIVEVPREHVDTLLQREQEQSSIHVREKVTLARERQQYRYKETFYTNNAQLMPKDIYTYIQLSQDVESFMKQAVKRLHLSPRVLHRLLKLARSIADFDWDDVLQKRHLAEALQYRAKHLFVQQ